MLLKLREDNSHFLPARSSLCFVGILRICIVPTYNYNLLENPIDIHLHENEFIMPVVLIINLLLIKD